MNQYLTIAILSVLCYNRSYSQEQLVLPTDLKTETRITEPLTLRKGFSKIEMNYNYFNFQNYIDADGNRIYENKGFSGASSWEQSVNTLLHYGINNNLEVGLSIKYGYGSLQIPYTAELVPDNQVVSLTKQYIQQGFGDLMIHASYQFVNKTNWLVGTTVTQSFPTGSTEETITVDQYKETVTSGFGRNNYSTVVGFLAKRIHYPYFIQIMHNSGITYGDADVDHGSFHAFEAQSGVLLNDWFSLSASLNYILKLKDYYKDYDQYGPDAKNASASFLVTQQLKRFRIEERIDFPFWARNSYADPLYSVFLSYKF
jgi:hypothetical protein